MTKFGQYQLLDRIAIGGMAEIFRGRSAGEEGFEKLVAIKRILPAFAADTRFVSMLVTEARIHAALAHRNVVQIHDLGISPDDEYFIVLEYVDGADLGTLLERMAIKGPSSTGSARLPDAVALHIAIEVGEGLHFAHEICGATGEPLGLIHRDISPSNVLLSYAGEVKLSDFGLAKRGTDHSVIGSLKGKLAYMAPEQARRGSIDRRSDIFALGAVLFELVTGQRLREISDDISGWQQVASSLVPSPRRFRQDLPVAIEQLLTAALAPDPRDRFPDARAFVDVARAALAQLPRSRLGEAHELETLLKGMLPPGDPRPVRPASKVIRLVSELVPLGLATDAADKPPSTTTEITAIVPFPKATPPLRRESIKTAPFATVPRSSAPTVAPRVAFGESPVSRRLVSQQQTPPLALRQPEQRRTVAGHISASQSAAWPTPLLQSKNQGGWSKAEIQDYEAAPATPPPTHAPSPAGPPSQPPSTHGSSAAWPPSQPPSTHASSAPAWPPSQQPPADGSPFSQPPSQGVSPSMPWSPSPSPSPAPSSSPASSALPARPPSFAPPPLPRVPMTFAPDGVSSPLTIFPPSNPNEPPVDRKFGFPDREFALSEAQHTPQPAPKVARRGRLRSTALVLALVLAGLAGIAHFALVPLEVLAVWDRPARIEVTSDPGAATVYLDGKRLSALTPTYTDVARDRSEHVLELRRDGFRSHRRTIRYDRDVALSIHATLEPSLRSPGNATATDSPAEVPLPTAADH